MGLLSFLSSIPKDVGNVFNGAPAAKPAPVRQAPTMSVQPAAPVSRPITAPSFNAINASGIKPMPTTSRIVPGQTDVDSMAIGMLKGLANGASGLVKTSIISPAVQTLASLSSNPYVKQAADQYTAQSQQQFEKNLLQPIITRPAAELVNTLAHPTTQSQYNPGTPLEKALFGNTPVENINKNVAKNYDAHSNLPAWQRLGLSGLDATGQVINVLPTATGAVKVAKYAKDAGDAAKVSAIIHGYSPDSGFIAGKSATGYKAAEANGVTFKGIEGAQKFEGGDQASKFKTPSTPAIQRPQKLGDVLQHPLLYKNYPGLKDVHVRFDKTTADGAAKISRKADTVPEITVGTKGATTGQIKGTLLHEIQHIIQDKENFARGGSPAQFGSKAMMSLMQKGKQYTGWSDPKFQTDFAKEKMTMYRQLAGETEARNVTKRMNYSDQRRLETPVAKTEDVPRPLQTVDQKYRGNVQNPSHINPDLTSHENTAIKYLRDNPTKALADYKDRTMRLFDTNKPNIVSADDAKHIIPGFDVSKSVAYHEPGSGFVKKYYTKLLEDPKTKDQPVLFTGGGTGAGKTTSLLSNPKNLGKANLNGFAAVYDGNLANTSSAIGKIDKALDSGRKVQIAYVFRDPIKAFTEGVLPRAMDEGRVIDVNTHASTHVNSLKTIQELYQHYKGNPNVSIRVIDNSRGFGNSAKVPMYFLSKKVYNIDRLKGDLHERLNQAEQSGKIDQTTAQSARGEGLGGPIRSESEPERGPETFKASSIREEPKTSSNTGTGVRAGTPRLNKAFGTDLPISTYTKRPQEVLRTNSETTLKSQGLSKFTGKVTKSLAQTPGRLTDQQLSDAYLAAEKHGEAGNTDLSNDLLSKTLVHDSRTAQALAARGMLTKSTPLGMHKTILTAFKKAGVEYTGDVKTRIDSIMSEVKATQPGTPEREFAVRKLANATTDEIPRSGLRTAAEFWRAMLLSGPQTAAKVAISQPFSAAQAYLNQFPAAAADMLRSKVTGAPRTIATAPLRGSSSLLQGLKDAGTKLKTGVDVPGSGGFVSPFESTVQRGAHQTAIEKTIFNTHSAIQKPTYEFIRDNTLGRLGKAQAINQGLKGADRNAFIKNYIKTPPPEAYEHAIEAGEKATNQQRTALGTAAGSLQKLGSKDGGPGPGIIVAPITRVPGAIATNALYEYSGAKFVKSSVYDGIYKGLIKGKAPPNTARTIAEDFGKAVVGAGGVAGLGAILASGGNITPPKAESTKQAALLKAQGKPTGSFKIPGTNTWISVNALGPVGIELQIGAGFKQGAATALARGGQEIAQQPYLQGISGVGNALSNPKEYAKSFVNDLAGSTVPAFVSQTAAGFDKKAREINYGSVKDVIKSKIPGVRESIPAAPDVLGGPNAGANKTGNFAGGVIGTLDALKPSTGKNTNDPVTNELDRLNTTLSGADSPAISQPLRTQTVNGQKMNLTDKQLADYTKASGDIIRQGVTNLLANPKYQAMSDIDKAKQVNSVITNAHDVAKINVLGDNPKTVSTTSRLLINDPTSIGKTTTAASGGVLTPKQQYQANLDKFNSDVSSGKLDSVQQYSKQQTLAKQAVTSNYPSTVTQLYAMSKSTIASYLAANPSTADQTASQLTSLDNSLVNAGIISKAKFTTSPKVSTSKSGSTKKVKSSFNLSALKATNSLLKGKAVKLSKATTYSSAKSKKVSTPKLALLKPTGKRA